jgi:hypothetical protein
MGSWGAGLYDDDEASDLRQSIALITKIPANGDRLLEILLKQIGRVPELNEDGGPTFWLVIADQFERRGIHCAQATDRALIAIESGADLNDLESRGQDSRGLRKRKSILDQLKQRLRSPKPERKIPKKPKPPDAMVQVGDVYSFPTMAGIPFASHVISSADFDRRNFNPDGWGAIVVLDQGRAFDWIPWCALASVAVDPSKVPALPDLLDGELLYHSQTKGATRCLPKRSEFKDVPFELVGRLELAPEAARSVIAKWPSVDQAVEFGWSLRTVAFGRNSRFSLPKGPLLSSLVMAR